MKTNPVLGAILATLTIALLGACGSPLAQPRGPRDVAHIYSGDVVSYNSQGSRSRVQVINIDGRPIENGYGPLEIPPGNHTINLNCDGAPQALDLIVAQGEIYRFVERTTAGVKGCVARLSRVRRANP